MKSIWKDEKFRNISVDAKLLMLAALTLSEERKVDVVTLGKAHPINPESIRELFCADFIIMKNEQIVIKNHWREDGTQN